MKMFKTMAMINSIDDVDECTILSTGSQILAEYKGVTYTAIFNPFTGYYYVDNVNGAITNEKDMKG